MVNPHGDIFDWYGFDIGHPIPDSVIGNTVTETHFIVEESDKNRNKYRTDNKDVVKYYTLSNMKLQELMDAVVDGELQNFKWMRLSVTEIMK